MLLILPLLKMLQRLLLVLFMVNMLVNFVKIVSYAYPDAPHIHGNYDFKTYDNERYIEKHTGETLSLNCSSYEEVYWSLPKDASSTGHDVPEVELRLEQLSEYTGEIQLTLGNLKQSDTGLYTCIGQISATTDSVYVFVSSKVEDSDTGAFKFLNSVPQTLFVPFDEPFIVIPCRTNRFIATEPKLIVESLPLTGDEGIKYDPRTGFTIIKELLPDDLMFTAICEYEDEKSVIIVLPDYGGNVKGSPVIEASSRRPYIGESPVIEASSRWPYIGESLSLICTFYMESSYKYHLDWECPRCSADLLTTTPPPVKLLVGYVQIFDGIRKSLHISDLNMEDEGLYKCNLVRAGDRTVVRSASYYLNISQFRGQLKVLNFTQKLDYNEGDRVELIHIAEIYPAEAYKSTWTKSYSSAAFDGERDEKITKSAFNSSNGLRVEEYRIENATIEDSGTYRLNILVAPDYKYNKSWNIRIKPNRVQPEMVVHNADGIPLEFASVMIHSTITILCSVKDAYERQLHLLQRGLDETDWEELPSTMLGSYSYEIVITHSMFAEKKMMLRCTADGSDYIDEKVIFVTTIENISVGFELVKNTDQELAQYESNEIFEGDLLRIQCKLPPVPDFTVSWLRHGIPLQPLEKLMTDSSVVHVHEISRVVVNDSGAYHCQAKPDGDQAMRQEILKIQVKEIIAPEINESLVRDEHDVKYGGRSQIVCPISSQPEPKYTWRKDGLNYEGPGSSTYSLEFLRTLPEDEGIYTCHAVNRAGSLEVSTFLKVTNVPQYTNISVYWWVITIAALLFILLVIAIFCMVKQRRTSRLQRRQLQALYEQLMGEASTRTRLLPTRDPKYPLHERLDMISYDKKYEIDRENITLIEKIGGGHFGVVNLGELRKTGVSDRVAESEIMKVAVKLPRDGRNIQHQKTLADELKFMIAIGIHPNILSLVGAVTKGISAGQLYIVMEYCEEKNLRDFLVANSGGFLNEIEEASQLTTEEDYLIPKGSQILPATQVYRAETDRSWAKLIDIERVNERMLTTSDLISFGYQIANGMQYLAEKICIHRDLAARNVLVTKQRAIRIADFGLARKDHHIYHIKKSKNVPLPFKWMAPESILKHDFTEASDVWSYGVTLWEIFSLGRVPYQGITSDELIEYLQLGNRLEQPKAAADEIYNLMRQCWLNDPKNRSNFALCKEIMKEHLKRASPLLLRRLHEILEADFLKMQLYDDWRGKSEENMLIQAARNGFIASSNEEQHDNLYTSDLRAM